MSDQGYPEWLIGEVLKSARQAMVATDGEGPGLTQQEFANRAGVSAPYLSQIETGKRPVNRKLAHVLLTVLREERSPHPAEVARAIQVLESVERPLHSRDKWPLEPVPTSSAAAVPGRRPDQVGAPDDADVWVSSGPSLPRVAAHEDHRRRWPGSLRRIDEGTIVEVPMESVGIHGDGWIWNVAVDPGAGCRPPVVGADGHPWLRRLAGRWQVDMTKVPGGIFGLQPATARHSELADAVLGFDDRASDYEAYLRSRILISLPGQDLSVTARGTGEEPEAGEEESDDKWPVKGHRSVHVITAANPWPDLLTEAANAGRHSKLVKAVTKEVGESPDAWVDARCIPPPTAVNIPSDRAVAVFDIDDRTALELAEQFQQTSVFVWTPERLSVLTLTGATFNDRWRLLED